MHRFYTRWNEPLAVRQFPSEQQVALEKTPEQVLKSYFPSEQQVALEKITEQVLKSYYLLKVLIQCSVRESTKALQICTCSIWGQLQTPTLLQMYRSVASNINRAALQ